MLEKLLSLHTILKMNLGVSGSYTNLLPGPMELQLNCRESILNNQLNKLERSLIIKDRLKKPLHHKTRQCRGGARGLAGLPWVAVVVLKVYFNGQGLPPEKCGI